MPMPLNLNQSAAELNSFESNRTAPFCVQPDQDADRTNLKWILRQKNVTQTSEMIGDDLHGPDHSSRSNKGGEPLFRAYGHVSEHIASATGLKVTEGPDRKPGVPQ